MQHHANALLKVCGSYSRPVDGSLPRKLARAKWVASECSGPSYTLPSWGTIGLAARKDMIIQKIDGLNWFPIKKLW